MRPLLLVRGLPPMLERVLEKSALASDVELKAGIHYHVELGRAPRLSGICALFFDVP